MRLHHIDIAKGIGILAVVALHANFHLEWMTAFEMPLFFLLSGIFVKVSVPFKEYLIKKINMLLVPYVFFESPKLIYDAYFALTHKGVSFIDSYINSSLPTATWFLLALFLSQIMCYPLLRVVERTFVKVLLAILMFAGGYVFSAFQLPNVMYVGSAITLSSFLLVGNALRIQLKTLSAVAIWVMMLAGLACLSLCWVIYNVDTTFILYRSNQIVANLWAALLMGFLGSGGVIFLSASIRRSKLLEYYGCNSLIVLGAHLYFVVTLQRLSLIKHAWVLFLVVCVVVLPVIYLLKKYLPQLCGAKPLIK